MPRFTNATIPSVLRMEICCFDLFGSPDCYASYSSDKEPHPKCNRPGCDGRMTLMRHVSFVDCPGHDVLMATMLNGAAVMDAALLLIAGNEPCPQPQTSEHLAAVEIMKLNNIIILQNKIGKNFTNLPNQLENAYV